MKKKEDYVPFGQEWIEEMMRFKKEDLVQMLKQVLMTKEKAIDRIKLLTPHASSSLDEYASGYKKAMYESLEIVEDINMNPQ